MLIQAVCGVLQVPQYKSEIRINREFFEQIEMIIIFKRLVAVI